MEKNKKKIYSTGKELVPQKQPQQRQKQQATRHLPVVQRENIAGVHAFIQMLKGIRDALIELNAQLRMQPTVENFRLKKSYATGTYFSGGNSVFEALSHLFRILRETFKKTDFLTEESLLLADPEAVKLLLGLSCYGGFYNFLIYSRENAKTDPTIGYDGRRSRYSHKLLEEDICNIQNFLQSLSEEQWSVLRKRARDNFARELAFHMEIGSKLITDANSYYYLYAYAYPTGLAQKDIQAKVSAILQQEEKRLRKFLAVLYTVLQFLTTVAPFFSEQAWKPRVITLANEEAAINEIIHILTNFVQGIMVIPETKIEEVPYFSPSQEPDEAEDYETVEPDPYFEAHEPTQATPVTIKPTHTWLGKDIQEGSPTKDKFIEINDKDREEGIYIVGRQGVGKSTLMQNLIYQDLVKGHAIIVIDAHGDLINNVIAQMPTERLTDTYLFDLTERDYPFSLNVFLCQDVENEAKVDSTRNQVTHAFVKLWPRTETGQYFNKTLSHVIITLIENPELTMAHVPLLFNDIRYREKYTRHLNNTETRAFWKRYDKLSPIEKRRESQPLLDRLDELLREPVIKFILCQQKAKSPKKKQINFREAIDNHEVILIRLPLREEGYETSAPKIGIMLMAQIYAAVFSYADIKEYEKRPGFSLYVDEFQNFATDEYERVFSEGRKYRARQTLAHQRRDQISEGNKRATLSASTRFVFQVIENDARELAHGFSDISLKTRPDTIYPDVLKRMRNHDNSDVRYFYETYVVPMERRKKEIIELGWEYKQSVTFQDTLDNLEMLLYLAQKQGKIDDEIEERTKLFLFDIAIWQRFAGYYYHTKKGVPLDLISTHATNDITTHFYRRTSIFTEEMLKEEEGRYKRISEDLAACIKGLLDSPMGEMKETTDSERATTLQNLGKGIAWVKTPNKSFVLDTFALESIRTHSMLSPEKRQGRKEYILNHTRGTYCRKRSELEKELAAIEDQLQQYNSPASEETIAESENGERPRFEDVE